MRADRHGAKPQIAPPLMAPGSTSPPLTYASSRQNGFFSRPVLAPGWIVDFCGTVSDQSTDGGVNVTTVTRLKVLVVDGLRVAPTPKPKKRKKGAEDGEDDDDEPAAAAKKARVAEGDETDDG